MRGTSYCAVRLNEPDHSGDVQAALGMIPATSEASLGRCGLGFKRVAQFV